MIITLTVIILVYPDEVWFYILPGLIHANHGGKIIDYLMQQLKNATTDVRSQFLWVIYNLLILQMAWLTCIFITLIFSLLSQNFNDFCDCLYNFTYDWKLAYHAIWACYL